jgi:DNA-binding transcriptional MerR regulator
MDGTRLYTIGELARRTGLTVKTIRFYSDAGVVPPTDRTHSGYRLYSVESITKLELVRTLRELGAGLDEVQRVLARETTLSSLADAHLALLEQQMRVLRTRRAVLRAVVKQDSTIDEVRLMHKVAQMSDEERYRLIDEFWEEITEGLDQLPDFAHWRRSTRPNLPEDPSIEQLQAWIELAELVRDTEFRRAVREFYRERLEGRNAEFPSGPESESTKKRWAIINAARKAMKAGKPPSSAQARSLADRLVRLATAENGKDDTAEFRTTLARDYDQLHDERLARFWELLTTINEWPKRPTSADTTNWLAEALRASARQHPGAARNTRHLGLST